MADTPSSSKQKIQRASKPKVKTGCITCKKRRVKCDETKPECLRCQNFGCSCDGYEFSSEKISSAVQRRALAPKTQRTIRVRPQTFPQVILFDQAQESQGCQALFLRDDSQKTTLHQSLATASYGQLRPKITAANPTLSAVLYSPSITIFESEQETRYYRYYCETTAPQLSGCFGDGTWNHALLEACHEEPFVRRAIIAIAALSKAMEISQHDLNRVEALSGSNKTSTQNPHHMFALQHYGKAVRQMRDAMRKGDENIRMALISCLLTICFESFHGHHENAIGQIGAGLNIMQEWLKKQPSAKHLSGLRSPNPLVVNDRLFHSFVRLDVAAMHFFDRRPSEFHLEESLEGSETIKQMPASFSNLEEAGIYFAVVMKRIMHFIKWIESKAIPHRHHRQGHLGPTDLQSTFPNTHLNTVLGTTFIDELEGYSGELGRWSTAFQPVIDRSRTPDGQMELVPASLLRLHQTLLSILLGGLKCHEECLFDQFLAEFTDVVDVAENLLGHPYLAHSAGKAVFVFDPNIILPLLVVAIKCRDGVVRRKAIELLQANPRREGTWDSSLAAAIGFWHMTLEEEGLEVGDFVPEQSRVRMVGVKQDFAKRTAHLSASQVVDGVLIIHETIVHW